MSAFYISTVIEASASQHLLQRPGSPSKIFRWSSHSGFAPFPWHTRGRARAFGPQQGSRLTVWPMIHPSDLKNPKLLSLLRRRHNSSVCDAATRNISEMLSVLASGFWGKSSVRLSNPASWKMLGQGSVILKVEAFPCFSWCRIISAHHFGLTTSVKCFTMPMCASRCSKSQI